MTAADPDEDARNAAVDFVRQHAMRWQAALGTELLGVYLIGSLAHGGFSRRYSDIDAAVITETGLTPQQLEIVRSEPVARVGDWSARLSVFWTDRHFDVGRFPQLDRVDYLDHAIALLERERVRPARPTPEQIQDYLRGAPFTNWADNARRFADATTLEPGDRKAYLRALLYPARFCYSYLTGRMGSNDDAVAFLRAKIPPRLDLECIERALQCRRSADDPDILFSARTILPAQVDACAALFIPPLP